MAIVNEQMELSNKVRHDQEYSHEFITSSTTLERMHIKNVSGNHGDYQYPDNRPIIDGQNTITSETGIETINNSKTAGVLG